MVVYGGEKTVTRANAADQNYTLPMGERRIMEASISLRTDDRIEEELCIH